MVEGLEDQNCIPKFYPGSPKIIEDMLLCLQRQDFSTVLFLESTTLRETLFNNDLKNFKTGRNLRTAFETNNSIKTPVSQLDIFCSFHTTGLLAEKKTSPKTEATFAPKTMSSTTEDPCCLSHVALHLFCIK